MRIPSFIPLCRAALVLLAGAPPAQAAGGAIDVYLIGGQSNATGQGYLANLPAGFAPDTRVLLYHSGRPHLDSGAAPDTWVPLRQASESPDRFGPELGLGNRLQELFPGRRIALIKHAHSGTNLYRQWAPGASAGDRSDWGPQFAVFVDTVEGGLAALRAQGDEPVLRGMVWQQGESDADRTEHGDAYAANLAHFIARVREQFHAPALPFVYGYVMPAVPAPGTYPGRDAVRRAEHDLDENSGSPLAVKGARVVATADLGHRADDPHTRYPKDHLHFGTLGMLELGRRMADRLAAPAAARAPTPPPEDSPGPAGSAAP